MKRLPFEHPTDKYDEKLFPIDEQLCALLKERKEISGSEPGIPPEEAIANWSLKYNLYEDYLKSLFGTMRLEDHFKPRVEPTGFRKHLPVLKSVEVNERFYSVTFIRQYENASVIHLNVDWHSEDESSINIQHARNSFELFLLGEYDCRSVGGRGSIGTNTYNFIVSPALPDNISGLELAFKEYSDAFKDKPTGLEIVMHL